jgi:hypothetical protein
MNLHTLARRGRLSLIAACAFAALGARAETITYTFSAIASGTLRTFAGTTTSFTDRALSVTLPTDTGNIDTTRFGLGVPATHNLVRGFLSIDGVGSSPFNDLLYVFNNQDGASIGFGDLTHNDLFTILNTTAGLGAYGLVTALGPIGGSTATDTWRQFNSVIFDFGAITLTRDLQSVSFQAALAAVPEPQTWGLMLAGLGFVGALARRRARG